jgi:ABC-2 type transport system permease protein
MNAEFLTAYTLWQREIVRFYRQPNRVIGAVGSPLLFWLLLGSGMGRSFTGSAGEAYLVYAFPGTLVLTLLFTAIFSTISIIEDRREGFLQSVLVAPVARPMIVLGKVLGGATLAFLQAALLLVLAPLAGIPVELSTLPALCGVLFGLGLGLTSLGFVIAWRMQSTQGFHAVMNLFLLPLWLLSGALFPPAGASPWLQVVIRANPLTYGLASVRRLLVAGDPGAGIPGLFAGLLVTTLFAAAAFAAASIAARGHTRGDLL